ADKAGLDEKVSVTDWATGKAIAATSAVYLYGMAEKTGRPTIKAFADRAAALKERQVAGGSIVGWEVLKRKELAARCGFCDRAVYPEDAAAVTAGGVHTWGCCSHCAMGVSARMRRDVQVRQKDRQSGQEIVIRTMGGYVASIQPPGSVAWFGMKKRPDGTFGSAGCFHQGFFTSPQNLKKWLERNPSAVGRMISIDQALGDKMRLTPREISMACKVGECSPK
ncbi:MAG: organomercurial lyase, partial [Planctomycetota bacterium]